MSEAAMLGGDILSAGLSIYGDQQQAQAAQAQLDFEKKLAKPGMKARNYLLSLMGKESPLLAAQYTLQSAQLGRAGATAGRQAGAYWGAAGNLGRSRGEIQRAKFATTQAQGELALQYGGAQTSYGQSPAYALAGQPTSGISQALQNRTSLAGAGAQDFGVMLNSYLGYKEAQSMLGTNNNPVVPNTGTAPSNENDNTNGSDSNKKGM